MVSGIKTVKGVKVAGVRSGNWLTGEQAQELLNAPNVDRLKGLRDRAILAVLIGCGLLMVSRFPYPHVLNRLVSGRKSFPHLVVAAIFLFLCVLEWQIVLVTISLLYVLTGPLLGTYRLVTGRRAPIVFEDEEEDEGPEFDEPDEEEDELSEPPEVVEGPGRQRA